MNSDLCNPDPILLTGSYTGGAAVLHIDNRVGGYPMLNGPAKDHVIEFRLIGLPFTGILCSLPSGSCRLQVSRRTDGVDRRLLDNDPAIHKGFEVNKAVLLKIGETVDTVHADYA